MIETISIAVILTLITSLAGYTAWRYNKEMSNEREASMTISEKYKDLIARSKLLSEREYRDEQLMEETIRELEKTKKDIEAMSTILETLNQQNLEGYTFIGKSDVKEISGKSESKATKKKRREKDDLN